MSFERVQEQERKEREEKYAKRVAREKAAKIENVNLVIKFAESVNDAVKEFFNNVSDPLEDSEIKSLLGVMQYEIRNIWDSVEDIRDEWIGGN